MTSSGKDSDPADDEADISLGEVRLPTWARTIATLLGAVGGVAGGVAVFVSENGAGTLGLLLACLVLTVVGLSGVLPTRLKLGQGEVEWKARQLYKKKVAKKIEEILEDSSDERAVELAERLLETPAVEADPFRGVAAVFLYDQKALNALRRVAPPGATIDSHYRSPSGHLVDARVSAGSHQVNVEFRYRTPRGPLRRRIEERLRDDVKQGRAHGGLLIFRPDDATTTFTRQPWEPGYAAVAWRSEEDDDTLRAALLSLLNPHRDFADGSTRAEGDGLAPKVG